ncbi:hypothetical protein ACFLZH_02685 [Patescibacteria group bacterium]
MPLSESIPENKDSHIKILYHFLYDFSNDIPETWISGNGNFKVRMNWWQPLIDTLDLINMETIEDQVLKQEIEAFICKYSESGITHIGIRKENIDEADLIIQKVIKYLQNSI